MKFYAEFNTDKIVREKFFPSYEYKGIMVEVGGATPQLISMSKHFKDNGWRTIIIEPNPYFVDLHKKYGNEIYQFACSNEDGFGDFTIVKQNENSVNEGIITDHSFSSLSVKEGYINKHSDFFKTLTKENIKVEIRKLNTILDNLKINKVDIVSIDVEGWEIEVMMGLDTKKIDCTLFIIENYLEDENYVKYFDSIGYKLVDQIQHNQIYIKK